jgi:hypothetical protein
MDFPGHLCRRIVSVSVSILGFVESPTAPNINNLGCTLNLQQHKYRISAASEEYKSSATTS